jgi:hypothetical protein
MCAQPTQIALEVAFTVTPKVPIQARVRRAIPKTMTNNLAYAFRSLAFEVEVRIRSTIDVMGAPARRTPTPSLGIARHLLVTGVLQITPSVRSAVVARFARSAALVFELLEKVLTVWSFRDMD